MFNVKHHLRTVSICCRMLHSRACSVAGAFDDLSLDPKGIRC